jgi:hypothetical protein
MQITEENQFQNLIPAWKWCICNIMVWIPAMGTNNGHDNVSLYDPSKDRFERLS